jgi:hypothetical protein
MGPSQDFGSIRPQPVSASKHPLKSHASKERCSGPIQAVRQAWNRFNDAHLILIFIPFPNHLCIGAEPQAVHWHHQAKQQRHR